ncbi:MAG TPA: flavodoxin family protein [Bacteroidales bacterium]|nr:flavodoxin family protein [Bacteroidales bacterium]HPT12310.1 flavodoxin family protein [Bacteroidales bacterium]
MKKAAIVFQSRTGITRAYAEEIETYLQSKGIEVVSSSVRAYKNGICDGADYLLLGCWTNGLMVMFQHPDREWNDFAKKFENSGETKTALFTTYKILTGSMFKKMLKALESKINKPSVMLKSRNGTLSAADKKALDDFIGLS